MKRVLEKIIMKLSLSKTNYLLMVSFTIITVIKGILFQGFISNKNPYTIDIIKGYNACEDYILYYLAFSMIIFSFSFLLVEYNKTYDFRIKGDSLTLTSESTGKSTVFTRQKTD